MEDNGTTNLAADPLSDVGHASFTITSVNDEPAGADNSVTLAEEGTYAFNWVILDFPIQTIILIIISQEFTLLHYR